MGLGATYDVHLRLIGKLVGDFLLVIIELFFARCFRFVTIHAFDRQTDRHTDGRTDRISTAIPCVYASHSRTVKIGLRLSMCQSVYLSVCQHSHCRIFLSNFTKSGTDVRTPKRKNEFVRGQYRTTPSPILCPQGPILGQEVLQSHENIK